MRAIQAALCAFVLVNHGVSQVAPVDGDFVVITITDDWIQTGLAQRPEKFSHLGDRFGRFWDWDWWPGQLTAPSGWGTNDINMVQILRGTYEQYWITNAAREVLGGAASQFGITSSEYGRLLGDGVDQVLAGVRKMSSAPVVGAMNAVLASNAVMVAHIDSSVTNFAQAHSNYFVTLTNGFQVILNATTNLDELTNLDVGGVMVLTNLVGVAGDLTNAWEEFRWSVETLQGIRTRLFVPSITNTVLPGGVMLSNEWASATNDVFLLRTAWADIVAPSEVNHTDAGWAVGELDSRFSLSHSYTGQVVNPLVGELGIAAINHPGNQAGGVLAFQAGGYEVDFNPEGRQWWNRWKSVTYPFGQWALILAFCWFVYREMQESVFKSGRISQLGAPDLKVFGMSVGWIVTPLYVVVTLGFLLAIPVFFVAVHSGGWLSGFGWAELVVNPLSLLEVNSAATEGLRLASELFPVAMLFSMIFLCFSARWVIAGSFHMSASLIRMMPK
jgi:hypothetical protein